MDRLYVRGVLNCQWLRYIDADKSEQPWQVVSAMCVLTQKQWLLFGLESICFVLGQSVKWQSRVWTELGVGCWSGQTTCLWRPSSDLRKLRTSTSFSIISLDSHNGDRRGMGGLPGEVWDLVNFGILSRGRIVTAWMHCVPCILSLIEVHLRTTRAKWIWRISLRTASLWIWSWRPYLGLGVDLGWRWQRPLVEKPWTSWWLY